MAKLPNNYNEAKQRITASHAVHSCLDLSDLGLTILPPEIGRLVDLEELRLWGNRLTTLPSEIGQLTNLRTLRLGGNQLTALPREIGQLTNLQTLSLRGNRLTALPREIGQLTNLQELELKGNRLSTLPREIGQLTNLRILRLGGNELMVLPHELGQLTSLQTLYLKGNPVAVTLQQWTDQGTPALLGYLRSLVDATPRYEAKLVLVGTARVGKSSLIARLRGEEFDPSLESTHGIELNQLMVPHPHQSAPILLNTWDFGGQDLYQLTHQFFWSPQALYLLVWHPGWSTEPAALVEWSRRIRLQVGVHGRALLIATHADDADLPDRDLTQLRAQLGHMLAGESYVDNSSGHGISSLRRVIAEQAGDLLPVEGELLSERWVAVQDALRTRQDLYLSYGAYQQLCAELELDAGQADALLGLLHRRGQLIHYANDPSLRDIVVLQPEWLTHAVSQVLDDPVTAESDGVLDHHRLRSIWPERPDGQDYTDLARAYLLRLLEKFDLSYRLDHDRSLIAQLVPISRPPIAWDHRDPPPPGHYALRLLIELSEPAPGIVALLTVRNHHHSVGVHWRDGLLLADPGQRAQALLTLQSQRQLAITVHAPYPPYLFYLLLGSIERLLAERWKGITYQASIPCDLRYRGVQTRFCPGAFELTALQDARSSGEHSVACQVCHTHRDLSKLLTGLPAGTASAVSPPAPGSVEGTMLAEIHQRLTEIATTNRQIEVVTQRFGH
jgi:internalin A